MEPSTGTWAIYQQTHFSKDRRSLPSSYQLPIVSQLMERPHEPFPAHDVLFTVLSYAGIYSYGAFMNAAVKSCLEGRILHNFPYPLALRLSPPSLLDVL